MTNALLHPAAINAQSGSAIQYANTSATGAIVMPKIVVTPASSADTNVDQITVNVSEYTAGTMRVIGIYGNGANDAAMDPEAAQALVTGTGPNTIFTVPRQVEGGPTMYLLKYERNVTSGAMLKNTTSVSSDLVKLTLFCAMGDPCEDSLRPCYVVIPRFAADPSMTISLDSETQEIDFSGNLNVDYCAGTSSLYYIYYPDEDLVVSGTSIS